MNRIPPQFLIICLLFFSISLFAQESRQNKHRKIEQTNLLLIEGGIFNMGQGAAEDILRSATINSFYVDATAVTNKDYRTFVNDLARETSTLLNDRLPDTSIWLRCVETAIGSQLAKDYFRVAAFDYYPVVGVSWVQATAFSKWRSDRQNEQLAIESGYWPANFQKKYRFSTSKFLAGDYHKKEGKELPKDLNGLLPDYKLLSEAEWEFAAWALIGKQELTDEGIVRNQIFNPLATEGKDKHHKKSIDKYRKSVLKHAKKHPLPSYYEVKKYNLPSSVFEGEINGYGIYNLNNNVAEWVQNSYRPIVKIMPVNPNTPRSV
jgi:sulfatase modifying factor 1